MTRRLLAAALLLPVVGLAAACSEDPLDATCGDFTDASTEERREIIRAIAEDRGQAEEIDAIGEAEGVDGAELVATGIGLRCEAEDDDTPVTEAFPED